MSYTDFIVQAGPVLGYLIIFAIVFAESGILVGFFLPGDSLLLALGLLASRGSLDIYWLILAGCLAAITGNSVGYATGRALGTAMLERQESRIIRKEDILRAEAFYKKYGPLTIVLARFTPVVRTFAPVVAGAARMPYGIFLLYNVIGGIAWASSISLLGYYFGPKIPNIDHYILPVIAVIVVASLVPGIIHLARPRRRA